MAVSESKRLNSLLFLYCETPLHAGTGAGVGAIDLPIQRERITGLPILQASGLKGALRSALEIPARIPAARDQWKKAEDKNSAVAKEDYQRFLPYDVLFGPDTDRAHWHAGALSLSDAKLLLFPVRSLVGVFAWATCPLILERFCRDLKLITGNALASFPSQVSGLYQRDQELVELQRNEALVGNPCDLRSGSRIVLEEYAFEVVEDGGVQTAVKQIGDLLSQHALPTNVQPYWKNALAQKLVVIHDEPFRALTALGTEVATRVAIDPEKGTVKRGALWTEEALPAESLLYAVASFSEPRAYQEDGKPVTSVKYTCKDGNEKEIRDAASLNDFFKDKLPQDAIVQLGGDETIGRGWARVRLQS